MEKGEQVDDFELPADSGVSRRLSELLMRGRVVLYFYPAASSRGCSVESRHFRDLAPEFAVLGAQVVGISPDDVPKQREFADRCSLGFPLLSDRQRTVAKEFGVNRRFGPSPVKRWTFIIDTDRTVLEVIKSEVNMNSHADHALAALRRLPR